MQCLACWFHVQRADAENQIARFPDLPDRFTIWYFVFNSNVNFLCMFHQKCQNKLFVKIKKTHFRPQVQVFSRTPPATPLITGGNCDTPPPILSLVAPKGIPRPISSQIVGIDTPGQFRLEWQSRSFHPNHFHMFCLQNFRYRPLSIWKGRDNFLFSWKSSENVLWDPLIVFPLGDPLISFSPWKPFISYFIGPNPENWECLNYTASVCHSFRPSVCPSAITSMTQC